MILPPAWTQVDLTEYNRSVLYLLTLEREGLPMYLGRTEQFPARYIQHLRDARRSGWSFDAAYILPVSEMVGLQEAAWCAYIRPVWNHLRTRAAITAPMQRALAAHGVHVERGMIDRPWQ